MDAKVCLVTGTSSGIGKSTAIGLAKLGANVAAVMRDSTKSDEALVDIKKRSGDRVQVLRADLSSQASIRDLAQKFKENYDRLDVLINNAGVYQSKRVLTKDGVETTFAVNVLAPFLLTNLLLDRLKSSAPSRIVNVSSAAANGASVDFQNLQGEKKFSVFGQYGQSKLALNLLTVEFSRRLEGTGVTANFLHPGVIRTGLARNISPAARILMPLFQIFMSSPEKGAKTSIYLATSPDVEKVSGKYFAKEKEVKAPEGSYDTGNSKKLWEYCENLTGLSSRQSSPIA